MAAAVRLPSPPTPSPGHLPSSSPPLRPPSPSRVAPRSRASRLKASAPAPAVKKRFSSLTWCRAEAGEQWRRDTPLPPQRVRGGPRGPSGGGGARAEVGVSGGRRSQGAATAPLGDSGKRARLPALFPSDPSWDSELSLSGQSGERGWGAVGSWRTLGRNGLPFGARGVLAAPSATALAALREDRILSLVRVLPLPAGICLLSFPGSFPSVD